MATVSLSTKEKLRRVLLDEDTFATVLLVVVLDLYGMDALQWTPDTLVAELRDDFAIELPRGNLDRLMAAVSIITSDDFFKRLSVFVAYCNVLSGSDFTPEIFDPADALECAWGIVEGLLLSGTDEDEPFTDEIRHYIGKVLNDEGIKDPPDVLAIALREGPSTAAYAPDFSGMQTQDADMFQVGFENQQAAGKSISDTVREQVLELIHQLEALPLTNGRSKDLIKKLQGGGWHS